MRYRLAKHPGESPCKALDEQLLWELQQEHTESNSKKLVSGVRLLEKFNWLQHTIVSADWLFIDAMQKVPRHKQEGRSKQWATMHCLRQLCQAAKTKLDWEVVALSALSIAFGLRISKAAMAAPDDAEIRFRGTKGRTGLHRPKVGPWARKWGDFLARLRALLGHHPHRPAFFTSKAHLAAAFLELVQSPGCTCKTIRWHIWRRFGAAQLQATIFSEWVRTTLPAPPPPPTAELAIACMCGWQAERTSCDCSKERSSGRPTRYPGTLWCSSTHC